jgi:hypothetical protein
MTISLCETHFKTVNMIMQFHINIVMHTNSLHMIMHISDQTGGEIHNLSKKTQEYQTVNNGFFKHQGN